MAVNDFLSMANLGVQTVSIPRDRRLADWMYERLVQRITEFQDGLKPDEEVGACLTHFGREVVIHIEDISYHNPDMIIFIGSTDAGRVELLQHSSQVNVLLVAVKAPADRPARRIGFQSAGGTGPEEK